MNTKGRSISGRVREPKDWPFTDSSSPSAVALRQVIHRIGKLERAFREAAREIAVLIAETEKDRVALFRDLAALGGLEIRRARERLAGREQNDRGPRITLLVKVAFCCLLELGRSAADEKHGHAQFPCALRQRQSRCQRLRLRERLPCPKAAWALLQIAIAVDDP